ncbi:MAG: ribose transport system substrate-binding protein, partial [Pseudonocardiales bacterium]|nr:ribose transport system substrate-binding protein [Pseudonocardiales bacterium]
MQFRRFGTLITAAAMAVALSACGSSSSNSGAGGGSAGGGGAPSIAIVSKGFQHQFWQAVKKGAEQEAQKEGATITFVGPPTEQDV